MRWTIVIILLLAIQANANSDISFKEGTNLTHSSLYFSGGIHRDLYILSEQFETGYFSEKRNNLGKKGSPFINYSIGLRCEPKPLFADFYVGVLAKPIQDSQLGGYFAFSHDAFLGLEDKDGKSVGLGVRHFSTANIFRPNIGRDYIMLRMSIGI